MKLLKSYLTKYKVESILGPLFKMLEAGFELFVPLVIAQMIDIGIEMRDSSYVIQRGGILLLLAVIGIICSLTAQHFAAKASVGVCTALRNDLFSHLNKFSFTQQDAMGSATLITRMTGDINQIQAGLNLALRLLLRSPFIVFGSMIMALTVDVTVAMVFLLAIPILSVVIFGIMWITMPLYKKVQKQLDRVTLVTKENLSGTRVIRAFNRQERENMRFQTENDQLVAFQIFVGKISALTNPFTYLIINIAIIAVIWSSGKQVNIGTLTQGETVALVSYMSQILAELIKLANLIVSISKAMACAQRVNDVFEMNIEDSTLCSDENTTKQGVGAKIVFSNVTFTYDGANEPSLDAISFQANLGETIGIIGGTGSGKTTLIQLILDFYRPQLGNVMVDGINIKDYSKSKLREKIGYVPQKVALLKGTLRENMQLGKENATDDEIIHALKLAQAYDFVEKKGYGLELFIEQDGKNLSGGQKQRLSIARALVKNPEVLILDDSASALDYVTESKLRMALEEIRNKKTIFVISQRIASIKDATKIIVLEEGMMVGFGTHQDLVNSCEVYRELLNSQNLNKEVM